MTKGSSFLVKDLLNCMLCLEVTIMADNGQCIYADSYTDKELTALP